MLLSKDLGLYQAKFDTKLRFADLSFVQTNKHKESLIVANTAGSKTCNISSATDKTLRQGVVRDVTCHALLTQKSKRMGSDQ